MPPAGVGVSSYSVSENDDSITICVEITAGGVERPVVVTLSTTAVTANCNAQIAVNLSSE